MSSTQQLLLGEGAGGGIPNYIEEVFSCFLYTGNGSTQTITNEIDLSTKGGLTWIKGRSGSTGHRLTDTARGATKSLASDSSDAEATETTGLTAFGTTGFTIGADADYNTSAATYVSWTFREQPKFFDVVTFTSNASGGASFNHSLGSVPGAGVYKSLASADDWIMSHIGLTSANYYIKLNTTGAQQTAGFDVLGLTSTSVTIPSGTLNASQPYVIYLFAHDAGGFGLTGTDNVISCGSFTTDGSGLSTVTLGYEPQFVIMKDTGSSGEDWILLDTMRGWVNASGSNDALLRPNLSAAEVTVARGNPTATGFQAAGLSGSSTYIYIAIRRGPMKVPTVGTSVFAPLIYTGDGTSGRLISGAGFPPDLLIQTARSASENREFDDRLRGGGSTAMNALFSNSTNVEAANSGSVQLLNQDGFTVRSFGNGSGVTYIGECFRRAPSFFDEVCYSGNSVAGRTLTHNLGVVPQLIILKARTIDVDWSVYAEPAGNTKQAPLNDVTRFTTGINCWNNTSPTASVFSLSSNAQVNRTGDTYVAYLFATCAGVSKVGSYTGTGSLQTINCGFTSGARFVLIKNQDVNGSWYVWDSARGITSGNDPYLLLNSTAAEVTNTNYVDTDSTGFKVTGNTAVNTSSDTYIFLAIA